MGGVTAEPDLVVVGGGPVGLATAIAARAEGLSVTLVEPRRPPVDKACGEGVMPAGVAALEALGVDAATLGQRFTGIRYVAGRQRVEADFPRGGAGRGVRRTRLHAALVARAEGAGVDLRWGVAALGLTAGGVETSDGELGARWVAGADGLRSKVRDWAGLGLPFRGAARFGVRRHLRLPPEGNRVEVIFGARAEAYVTPLGREEVGVALLWEGATRGFDDLLATRFPPAVAARFAGAEALSRDRGAGPFRQRTRGVVADGRVALVGDAAGYVDALTGEGLSLGFREARALAAALADGEPGRYARESRRLRRVPETITKLALFAARRPALAERMVAALGRDPALFSRLLGALAAGAPAREIGVAPALRFLWRLAISSAPA
jgi:flavin-dependent dehydrogenase